MSHTATFNILAFFQVVASGQISPHFRGAKIDKFSDMQYFEQKKSEKIQTHEKKHINPKQNA